MLNCVYIWYQVGANYAMFWYWGYLVCANKSINFVKIVTVAPSAGATLCAKPVYRTCPYRMALPFLQLDADALFISRIENVLAVQGTGPSEL